MIFGITNIFFFDFLIFFIIVFLIYKNMAYEIYNRLKSREKKLFWRLTFTSRNSFSIFVHGIKHAEAIIKHITTKLSIKFRINILQESLYILSNNYGTGETDSTTQKMFYMLMYLSQNHAIYFN